MPTVYRVMRSVLFICALTAAMALNALVPSQAASFPHVPHAFIIMMENEENSSLIGSPHAPFINSLIKQYGYAADYYGVTHPSLPNYLSTIAGSFLNTYDDWDGNRYSAVNIVDQMEARHLTWKAYMESLPHAGFNGDSYPSSTIDLYERKHDPFMTMRDIVNRPARRSRVVSGSKVFGDLTTGHVATLSYISPNLCHDMHGIAAPHSPCPPIQRSLIRSGDRYLSTLVPAILHSRAWTADSTIFVVWDEGDSIKGCCGDPKGDGGGKVVAIVIARSGIRHFVSHVAYNHYSLLKTLEEVWGLGCLEESCRSDVRPMLEFLRPSS